MDASLLATLSRLLDEALDCPPAERDAWIERLGPEYDSVKPRLRRLLTEPLSLSGVGFLGTLPKIDVTLDARAASTVDTAPAAGVAVGVYRLVRPLGEGGMGSVWLAERADGLLARPVALKLPRGAWIRADLNERIARERAILATLSHPNIARLYDAGITADGRPYLALEYVEGQQIDEYCRRAQLDLRARIQLVQQVAHGVAHAHAKLIIHRDLKPSNILVTAEGQVRLLDFGIAKLLDPTDTSDSTATQLGGRALTPDYASPEQIAGTPLGVASDVYSLGVVLYEMLTGVRPYRLRGASPLALEQAILEADVRRPSDVVEEPSLARALRGDLDTIVLKALKKNADERYASVSALADDLQRFLDKRPVLARPDSRRYRLRRFVARHRAAVAASVLVAVALALGVAVALWQAQVARAEQARADRVATFITSIFRDMDPFQQGSSRSVTAAEVLAHAEQQLARELGDEPRVRAELLRVLGQSYLGLGDMANATRVLTRAVAESEAVLPADDPALIDARLLLAESEHYVGKTKEAGVRLGAVLQAVDPARVAPEYAVRARVLQARFFVNEGRAETDAAEQAALAARDASLAALGSQHKLTAESYGLLATVYRWRGKQDLALENSQKAYELLLAIHGRDPKHPGVILAQNSFGRALNAAGDFKRAVPHLKASAANAAAVLGSDVSVQQFLGTLANAQIEYGELNEAVANLRKAASFDLRGAVVSDTYEAGKAYTMGRALVAARRPDEALPHLATAIELYRKVGNQPVRRLSEAEMGMALAHLGRLDEAERQLTALAADVPPRGRAAVQAFTALGMVQRLRGRNDAALATLERGRAASSNTPRERVVEGQLLTELALVRIERREYDEGARFAADAMAKLAEIQDSMTPPRADAMVALARAHIGRGRPADALPLLEQADAFWRTFAPDSPWARDTARRLAVARAESREP